MTRWQVLGSCAGLAAVLLGDAAAGEAPDSGVAAVQGPNAAEAAPGSRAPDAAAGAPCAHIEEGIARRKAWLTARREEQFLRGPVNPKKGVPNVVHLWCDAHPQDPDCTLSSIVVEVTSEEMGWSPDAGLDDYEAHVLAMKRELARCHQEEAARRRRGE
ncbi:MAG: hypothetical protein HY901_22635 [Deltaproteobacteria bacterium]|nr:hypothetical protein [Deltaproteobacteria bacterium]